MNMSSAAGPPRPSSGDAPSTSPVIPIGFAVDGVVSNWFSMVTTIGTPQTVAAQEMRVACMFPAD